mmetsp:Transcript_50835/g.128227  ORF Transcript_50835/g.128227 Transcript_50835/m.128227 type:complete len:209 (-) Transcript_50835:703-1329(-)
MWRTRGPDCCPFHGLAPSPRSSRRVPGHSAAMNLTFSPPGPINLLATWYSGVSSMPTGSSRYTKGSGRCGLCAGALDAAPVREGPEGCEPFSPTAEVAEESASFCCAAAAASTVAARARNCLYSSAVSAMRLDASSAALEHCAASCPFTWSIRGPTSAVREERLVPVPRNSIQVPGHCPAMRFMFSPPGPRILLTTRNLAESSRPTGS